ncbi:MAG: tryptophan synthase subunit alpha [Rhodothermales bacterium]|nr:tryptophan synthase subunit alpha [Rhodothermales bacterium]
MNRLTTTLNQLQRNGTKALGIFVTAGYPEREATDEILRCLDSAGVDFIELGMPFSDPLAEGSTIQETSEVALRNGVDLEFCLDAVSRFRQKSDTPLLLMGYINPIYKFGVSNFCSRAASSGVDGLIIADLPYHESEFLRDHAETHGLSVVHLVTPNTSRNRIEEIDRASTGFVYAVSLIGLTGADIERGREVDEYLTRLNETVVNNRVLAGFGIRSRNDANALAVHTDGVIVGSAFLKEVAASWVSFDSIEEKAKAVDAFVKSVRPTIGTTRVVER